MGRKPAWNPSFYWIHWPKKGTEDEKKQTNSTFQKFRFFLSFQKLNISVRVKMKISLWEIKMLIQDQGNISVPFSGGSFLPPETIFGHYVSTDSPNFLSLLVESFLAVAQFLVPPVGQSGQVVCLPVFRQHHLILDSRDQIHRD